MPPRKTACPRCREAGGDTAGDNLQVYIDGGYCHACGYTLSKQKLDQYLGAPSMTEPRRQRSEQDIAAELELIKTYPFGAPHKPDLPANLVQRAGIRYSVDDQGNPDAVYYPYYEGGHITDFKVRRLPKTFYCTSGKVNRAELFGQHLVQEGRRGLLVLVEGEDDKVAAEAMFAQTGTMYTVLSLQNGANEEGKLDSAVKRQFEFINSFKKVALCLDMDKPGKATTKALAEVLAPTQEVRLIKLPEGYKDAYDMYTAGQAHAFREALNNAERYTPEGIIEGPSITLAELQAPMQPGYALPFPMLEKKLHGLRKAEITLVTAGTGIGKCLGYGTLVMRHDGRCVAVQHIVPGDKLMGPDGTPRTVSSITSGIENLYRVDQCKGESYVVNESHILSLKSCTTKGSLTKGQVYNISVEEYLGLTPTKRHCLKGYKADLTELSNNDILKIDPYLLGLWIADGTASKPQITFNKQDLLLRDECQRILGYPGSVGPTNDRPGCITVDFPGNLRKQLKEYDLLDNKHIPPSYHTASYEDRLQLLAGWVDGDGHLSCGSYEVITNKPALADSLEFLARSVGLRARVSDKFSKCPGFAGAMYKRVLISGSIEKIPVRLGRKRFVSAHQKDALVTGITVTPLGPGRYYGFTLEEDPLFCLSDLTVTHNTTWLRETGYHLITHHGLTIGSIYLEEQWQKTVNGYIAIDNNVPLPLLRIRPNIITQQQWQASYDKLLASGKTHYFKHFGSVASEHLIAKMRYMAIALGCDFIFLDHVTMVMSGNDTLNERKDIDILMTRLAELVNETGVGVIPVVHLKRSDGKDFNHGEEVGLTDLRGSSQLEALSWNVIALERDQQGTQPDVSKLRLLKNREWGSLGVCDRMVYNPQTGRMTAIATGL